MGVRSFVVCLLAVGCTARLSDPDWWKHTIIYQVYPRSFQDSDGDGVGDLKGILNRLDHIQSLGVGTILLNPVFRSPMVDFGYDVTNFTDIDPVFGTMAEFEQLLNSVHDRGMYLLMEFIPNHTSDQHPWFVESCKGGENNPYSDYYRWSSGKLLENGTRVPPNNWVSRFDGSAWSWNAQRKQFYLHQYLKDMPDLDPRNPNANKEMKDVLKFWIEKGVDGFRLDAVKRLYETEDVFMDEPRSNESSGWLPHQYPYLDHVYTEHLDDIHGTVREWREVCDEFESTTGHHVFFVAEVYDDAMTSAMKYYESGADMSFNFNLVKIDGTCGGRCVHRMVDSWMKLMPPGKWTNHVLSSADQPRVTGRKSPLYMTALNMLLLTLPGTPTTYYGEEIGMGDVPVTAQNNLDRLGEHRGLAWSRDYSRGPMQWSAAPYAGFSTNRTWLEVNPRYPEVNVEAQMSDPKSPLNIYKQVAALRQDPAFRNSRIHYVTVNDNVISYVRQDRKTSYLIALNLGNVTSVDDHVTSLGGDVSSSGCVVVDSGSVDAGLTSGSHVTLRNIGLKPGDAMIVLLLKDDTTAGVKTGDPTTKTEL